MREQGTGDTREETADEEGSKLVAEKVNAHNLGGEVVVTDSHKSSAYPGTGSVLGGKDSDDGYDKNQVEFAGGGLENDSAE